jgi:hypothetical protein
LAKQHVTPASTNDLINDSAPFMWVLLMQWAAS